MERKGVLAAFVLVSVLTTFMFVSIFSQQSGFEWWDTKWMYRVGIEINSTGYDRYYWPIEYPVNFTDLFADYGDPGTFDINSTRVIAYDSGGSVLWEVAFQFDQAPDFNASNNAIGTIVFLMNGTTIADESRYYFIYFDKTSNGPKNETSFTSDLKINYTSYDEFNVNNSVLRYYVDTERGENTSGLYRVQGATPPAYNDIIGIPGAGERTIEYVKYSDGTYNYSFDFRNNFTVLYEGPIRIVVEMEGNETYWNDADNQTGTGKIVKRYTFYSNLSWIRVEQNFTNTGGSNITRGSPSPGALTMDAERALGGGYLSQHNTTDPGSWAWAAESLASWDFGVINVNESVSGFYAGNFPSAKQIGIVLNSVNITPGGYIYEHAVLRFNDTQGDENFVKNLSTRLVTPMNITRMETERITVQLDGKAYYNNNNVTYFNRNETVVIAGNITSDPYNLTKKVNATVDRGTAGAGDDLIMIMYDDGSHYDNQSGDGMYTNYFNLSNSEVTGTWNITITAYDENWLKLNDELFTIQVTDLYFVNTTVLNQYGLTNRVVNVTVEVKNYRQDIPIPGATINCSVNSPYVDDINVSDNGDGTYDVNFTAPPNASSYSVNCSASRNNNSGFGTDQFTCESPYTYITLTADPSNYTVTKVTWIDNESFNITVNATNTMNGSAFKVNISLIFPDNNFTADSQNKSCGNIMISDHCEKNFTITALGGTPAGNYNINVTIEWENYDLTTDINFTNINVTVNDNVTLSLSHYNLTGIIGRGKALANTNNFTVYASGNAPLTDINYTVSGFGSNFSFAFDPTGIPSIGEGNGYTVRLLANVTAGHSPGFYEGFINVTSGNDGYKIMNLTIVVSGTNMSINVSDTEFTADNISYYDDQSFNISVFTENLGNVTAYFSNITLTYSSTNITANTSTHDCGNVTKGANCSTSFNIIVTEGTPPGIYYVNATSYWRDPGEGTRNNVSQIYINVTSRPMYKIMQSSVGGNVTHGQDNHLGFFILNNTGNYYVYNITFNVTNITSDLNITFDAPNITTLNPGQTEGVDINVSVPLGYETGVHKGIINVTSNNAGYHEINLTITVSDIRTWTMGPLYCEKVMTPPVGNMCNVTINNTGNVPINFSITPKTSPTSMAGYTWTNVTDFEVKNLSSYTFALNYNATGAPLVFHYTNYTITGVQPESDPPSRILQAVLNPFVKPDISYEIVPGQEEQTGHFLIYANVTDHPAVGIKNMYINITTPENITLQKEMNYLGFALNGSKYVFYYMIEYPDDIFYGTWGNTTVTGSYNVTFHAIDNQNRFRIVSDEFIVYNKLFTDLSVGDYYQGDIGSVLLYSHEYFGYPLGGTEVNVTLEDPSGDDVSHYFWTGNSVTTGSNGYGGLMLLIPSDAEEGNYTLTKNSSYMDEYVNFSIYNSSVSQFEVKGETEITGKVDVQDMTVKGGFMTVSVIMLDHGNYTDPDEINLTIYYTSGYSPTMWRSLTKSNMNNSYPGFWSYTEFLGDAVATGPYLAILRVKYDNKESWDMKAFRIVSGGPYHVSVNMLEYEVCQADMADFVITMTNEGEAATENLVEFWISDGSTTWAYGSMSEEVEGGQTENHTESLPVVSYQPLGQYTINVKLTYDSNNTLYATANDTFFVVECEPGPGPEPGPEPGPSGPPAGPAGPPGQAAPAGEPQIEIVSYPQELGIEAGATKYPTITVRNTGNVTVYNVSLKFRRFPSPWFEITPDQHDEIKKGEEVTFTVKLAMPMNAEAKEYIGNILAISPNQTSDEKTISITVFGSRSELIQWEIERLKKALQELEVDVKSAKDSGKDVSEVEPLLDSVRNSIRDAEMYLSEKRYDDSLEAVFVGWKFIERARYLLSQAPFLEVLLVTTFPPWLIVLLTVLVCVVIALLIFMKRMRGAADKLFKFQATGAPKPTTVTVKKIQEKSSMTKETENIKRVLSLIEKEFQEGIISEKAYSDLKGRNEKKLKSIEETMNKL
ncbi:MAG: hypothetical protein JW754_02445 [Candidatus Aenigmarchaeota archaeon]|nr:hypothetical protein [Candidatus Aenigmarchaeota archaeon]